MLPLLYLKEKMANRDHAVVDALVKVAAAIERNQNHQDGNIKTKAMTDFQMYDYGQLVQKTKEYEEAYNERASAYRNSKARRDANNKGRNTLAPKGRNCKRGGCYHQIKCGKFGRDHYTRNCKESDIICFRCSKPGHVSRNCRRMKLEPQDNKIESTGKCLFFIWS